MSDLGVVFIDVRARLEQLDRDFDRARGRAQEAGGDIEAALDKQVSGGLKATGSNVDKLNGKLDGVTKTALSMGAAVGSMAIGRKLMDAADAASNLGEAQNATNVIFRDSSTAIDDFAKNALDNLGLAEITVRNMAAGVGGMFAAVGLESGQAAAMTQGLIARAVDVGSVFNESAQVVTDAFGAALRGESEPARRFGVFLSADAIAAEALSSGLVQAAVDTTKVKDAQLGAEKAQAAYSKAVKEHGAESLQARDAAVNLEQAEQRVAKALEGSKTELTEAQKMQAAYNIIMRSTEQTAGDYARTADSKANADRRASEAAKEASATLGESVAPIMAKVSDLAAKAAVAFSGLPGPVQTGIAALLGVAVVAGPLSSAITLLGGLGTAAKAAAVSFGPWLIAIGLVIAAGILLWQHWDTITGALSAAWDWIASTASSVWNGIAGFFVGVWEWIKGVFTGAVDWVTSTVGGAWEWVSSKTSETWEWIKGLVGGAWDWISSTISGGVDRVVGFVASIPGRVRDAVSGAFDWIVDQFRAAWNWLARIVNGIGFSVPDWVPLVGGRRFDLPDLPILDAGGIVSSPTLAMLSMNSRPEVVAPLDDLREMVSVEHTDGPVSAGSTYIFQGGLIAQREVEAIVRRRLDDIGRHNVSAGVKGRGR